MEVPSKEKFTDLIRSFNINTEYIVVKPNWVDDDVGSYTEPEILDWLLESFPNSKKVVVESYTPWRGEKYTGNEELAMSLDEGIKHQDFYKEQDKVYLEKTGIKLVLDKHNAEYVNVTQSFWDSDCVNSGEIKSIVEKKHSSVQTQELYKYIPNSLYSIREKATLISLSKIKLEESIPNIMISMSIKNLFGLIPHPSRYKFHGENHELVVPTIIDIYKIYSVLFSKSLWITEGIKTFVKDYGSENQHLVEDSGLLYVGLDGVSVDREACEYFGSNPDNITYLK